MCRVDRAVQSRRMAGDGRKAAGSRDPRISGVEGLLRVLAIGLCSVFHGLERRPRANVEPVSPANNTALGFRGQLILERGQSGPVDLWAIVMLLMVSVVEPQHVIEPPVAAHRVGLAVARLRAVVLEVVFGRGGRDAKVPDRRVEDGQT